MSASAPDKSPKMIEATIYDLHFHASNYETGDDADWTHGVADLLAAVTGERDQAIGDLRSMTAAFVQACQMLADAWDEGVSFGWHSTELRTDENPYRKAGL